MSGVNHPIENSFWKSLFPPLSSHSKHNPQVYQRKGTKEATRHQDGQEDGQEVGADDGRRREEVLPVLPKHSDNFYHLIDLIIRNLDLHSDKITI